jgi:hypothetical protein
MAHRDERIEEGDTVKVFPVAEPESAYYGVVKHMPIATGDSWIIVDPKGGVVYQQTFNRIVLMQKAPEDADVRF